MTRFVHPSSIFLSYLPLGAALLLLPPVPLIVVVLHLVLYFCNRWLLLPRRRSSGRVDRRHKPRFRRVDHPAIEEGANAASQNNTCSCTRRVHISLLRTRKYITQISTRWRTTRRTASRRLVHFPPSRSSSAHFHARRYVHVDSTMVGPPLPQLEQPRSLLKAC
jgi:hypothetical protein